MLDVRQRPLLVYWKLTRACELDCRAEAIKESDPLCPYQPKEMEVNAV